jgi:hypothetical protein
VFNTNKKIQIPKEFTLFGHKYNVIIKQDLFETEQCYGQADDDLKQIILQDVGEVKKIYKEAGKTIEKKMMITNEVLVETFFHEIAHVMLDAAGETKLSGNEQFVNIIGKAWLEIYLSSVYEKDSQEQEV